MNVRKMSYAENKRLTLEGLEEYYQEALGEEGQSSDTVSPYAETDDKISLVHERSGKIIGRLVGSYDHLTSSVRIEALYVDVTARGGRVGAALVSQFEIDAREKGVQIAFVDTTSSSAPTFYEKQGYSRIGEIEGYPANGEDYYLYMKWLK